MKRRGHALAALSSAVIALSSGAARVHAGDPVAAEFVYRRAMELMAKGEYEQACVRFEESQKLDAGIGTLLHLADCYEKAGRTASAWATFNEAADAARSKGQRDRESMAKKRASALAPKLATMRVTVPPEHEPPGLEVRRGQTLVPKLLWGIDAPVDPGTYEIRASAPGKVEWKTTVTVEPRPGAVSVSIPRLESVPPPKPAAPPPAARAESGMPAQRIAAIVAGGAGGVAMAVSAGIGFAARSRFDESAIHCDKDLCDQEGVDIRAGAKGTALAGTVVFIAGAATVGLGAVLWFTAPSAEPAAGAAGGPALGIGLGPGGGLVEGRVRW
jgi:hypothetical protein